MNCVCGRALTVRIELAPKMLIDGSRKYDMVGSCEKCNIDYSWLKIKRPNGAVIETNLERYYFG